MAVAETLAESVYECLKAHIDNGDLAPGVILKEADLARIFKVSRVPVAKAVQELEKQGRLAKRNTQGFVVAGHFDTEIALVPERLTIPANLLDRFDRQPSWEKIYERIERDLVLLMPFGSFKINELSMAKHYRVNRSIIQLVITRLCERGIADKPSQAQCNLLAYDAEFIKNRYELRYLLEPFALEKADPYIESREAKAYLNAHREVEREYETLAEARLPKLEEQIHKVLLARCPNPRVLVALKGAQAPLIATTRMIRGVLGHKVELPLIAEHIAVLDHLADGNIKKAANALLVHLERSNDRSIERLPLLASMPQPETLPYLKLR